MKTYDVHPAAECFPMMPQAELEALADNIKANGLLHPVELLDELVIDGRNRLAACALAGVEPTYTQVETEDPAAYVVSQNIARRHLDTTQRAAIAAELANLKHGGDRKSAEIKVSNDTLNTLTKAQAAQMMGVSVPSISRAKKVKAEDPELHEAAKTGGQEAVKAIKKSRKPQQQQQKTAPDAPGDEEMGWITVAKEFYPADKSGDWYRSKVKPLVEAEYPEYGKLDGRLKVPADKVEPLRLACAASYAKFESTAAETSNKELAKGQKDLNKVQTKEFKALVAQLQINLHCQLNDAIAAKTKELDEEKEKYAKKFHEMNQEHLKLQKIRAAQPGIMPVPVFEKVVRLLHSDRYPEECRPNLDTALAMIRQHIEPYVATKPKPKPYVKVAPFKAKAKAN